MIVTREKLYFSAQLQEVNAQEGSVELNSKPYVTSLESTFPHKDPLKRFEEWIHHKA